jgi:predicted RNA-binding Zn ribbon-like protein
MATVIVPAYNEQAVIAQTLEELLRGLDSDRVQVVVVCNGCTDKTADRARQFSPPVEVLEIETQSKTAAINAGERVSRGFPHIIQDADVVVSGRAMAAVIGALQAPGALVAEPRPVLRTSESSYPVRAFYRVWVALHGGEPGDVGSGVYGLSEEGRRRFGEFPELIADDAYARAHFASEEIIDVEEARSLVLAPRSVRDLVRIKTRSRLGQRELATVHAELWQRKQASSVSLSTKAARLPAQAWVEVPLYLALQFWIRLRAAEKFRRFESYEWERDRTG